MKVVSFDVETMPRQAGNPAPRILCASVADSWGAVVFPANKLKEKITAFLLDDNLLIVGHNIAFDMACVAAMWSDLLPLIWRKYDRRLVSDTMINEIVGNIAAGTDESTFDNGLAAVCKRRLNVVLDKGLQCEFHRFDGIPFEEWPQEAIQYSKDDAIATRLLWEHQQPTPIDADNQTAYAWALYCVSAWGMRTDEQSVADMRARLEAEKAPLVKSLTASGFLRKDGTKNVAMLATAIENILKDNTPKTATGKTKTDAATIEACNDAAIAPYKQFVSLEKLLSTYVPLLELGTRVPINVSFNVCVQTGRTSCREPNLQNLPRAAGIRECFVPRKGHVFSSVDYTAIEMYTLAFACQQIVGYSHLAEALNKGLDPHAQIACKLLSIPYESFDKKDKKHKEMRTLAKALNFGLPGGAGAERFRQFAADVYDVHITLDEAKKLKKQWLTWWPEVAEYHKHIAILAEQRVPLVHLVSGRRRGAFSFTSAANSFFQGLAADGAKRALYEVVRQTYDDNTLLGRFRCRVVMFVHDEIIAEMPEHVAHECTQEVERIMLEEMRKVIPSMDVKVEPTLMRRWQKEAGPQYDASGRLVPWGDPPKGE